MEDTINIPVEDVEVVDTVEYYTDVMESFSEMPDVARPLINNARTMFSKIKEMLYTAPSFINAVKAAIPEETFQAILTSDSYK